MESARSDVLRAQFRYSSSTVRRGFGASEVIHSFCFVELGLRRSAWRKSKVAFTYPSKRSLEAIKYKVKNLTTRSATHLSLRALLLGRIRYRQLYRPKQAGDEGGTAYRPIAQLPVPPGLGWNPDRLATSADLTSQGESQSSEQEFTFQGRSFRPPAGLHLMCSPKTQPVLR
jgi:hypothetical protein